MSPNRQSFRPPAGVTDKPSAALLPHDNESFRRTTNPFTQTTNPSHKRQIHPHKRQKSGHPSGYPDFPIVFRLNGKLHFLAHVGLLGNLRSGNLGRFGSGRFRSLRSSGLLGCGFLGFALDNGSLLDSVGLLRCGFARTARLGFSLGSGCRGPIGGSAYG